MTARPKVLKRIWFVILIIALAIGPFVIQGYALRQYVKNRPKRHVELTAFIESVYRYYVKNGVWPDEVTANRLSPLPPGWTYLNNTDRESRESSAMAILDGAYHTILYYRFEPPQGTSLSRQWIMTVEGDDTKFDAEVEYRLPSGSKMTSPKPNQSNDLKDSIE